MLERVKRRLVDDWRQAWRWWSVQLHLAGTVLASLLLLVPQMPAEMQALLPPRLRLVLVGVWAVAGLAARLVKQGGSNATR